MNSTLAMYYRHRYEKAAAEIETLKTVLRELERMRLENAVLREELERIARGEAPPLPPLST